MKSDRWTPVRHSDTYCAPGCGRGCTWKEYQRALRKAEALRRKMKTGDWRIHVHDNLGWHYSIVCGGLGCYRQIEVFEYDGEYHAGLFGGTPSEVHVSEYFKDPNKAVAAQLQRIRQVTAEWNAVLADLDKATKLSIKALKKKGAKK